MPRDMELFGLPALIPYSPDAVIPEDQEAFFAHGTKVFTAVR